MSAFIIRALQVIVYIVFFLCIIGGAAYGAQMGYYSGEGAGMVIGILLGLLFGFVLGCIYAGVIILLIDIRNTLKEINSKA